MAKQGNRKLVRKKIYNTKNTKIEKPISSVYSEIDTDLARDNIQNDLTSSDLQDL